MKQQDWRGVIPAITTPFTSDDKIDHNVLARHADWMVGHGCRGIVALGSLGEGGSLDPDEKREVLSTLVRAVGDRVPVVAGVAALSTRAAVRLAMEAADTGCRGLMVLPPYVYRGSWEELRGHVGAVMSATGLSCLLYNNPIAYGTDFSPGMIAELASEHENMHAVKESSADVRRVTAIRASLGARVSILVGVDDLLVEGVAAGAVGWIAGLVNAFPEESVRLFNLAANGRWEEADRLYQWFLPLLRMDVVPEFVHLIKLVQQEVGWGSEQVRGPRRILTGQERGRAIQVLRGAMAQRSVAEGRDRAP